ncbi:MAG: phosphatase PAP2 family protein [Flavisolibacter sp.]|jgi:undecaprenyl-diphosphatase
MADAKQVTKKAKGISIRFLIVAGMFLFSIAIFWIIADEIVLEKENGLDVFVFSHLHTLVTPAFTNAMLFITFFGSSYFLLPAYLLLILYYLVFRKNYKLSLDVAAIGITSTIILFSLKSIFHRSRPLDPLVRTVNGFSFPSGHSFSSFTFFGLIIFLLWQHKMNNTVRWALSVFFLLFACAIAFSRVYLHVHFASDVIAGFFLCVVWLGLSLWILKKFDRKQSF